MGGIVGRAHAWGAGRGHLVGRAHARGAGRGHLEAGLMMGRIVVCGALCVWVTLKPYTPG